MRGSVDCHGNDAQLKCMLTMTYIHLYHALLQKQDEDTRLPISSSLTPWGVVTSAVPCQRHHLISLHPTVCSKTLIQRKREFIALTSCKCVRLGILSSIVRNAYSIPTSLPGIIVYRY